MKACLLGACFALICTIHAVWGQTETDSATKVAFDDPEVQGSWHVVAIATDCQRFLGMKDKMKVMPITMTNTEDGNIKVTTQIPMKEKCRTIEMIFKNEDGRFIHRCEWGDKQIESVTKVPGGLMIEAVKVKGEKSVRVAALYAREAVMTPELLETFRTFAMERGFVDSQLIVLPREGACPATEEVIETN